VVGPKELRTTHLLSDGTQVLFRPIHPTDERDMRDLFYELSEQSKFYRFMSQIKRVPRSQIEDFVYVDHRSEVTIVGVLKEAHGEDIIAVGSYYLDTKTNKAEVAFTVIDQWQRRGIGTYMLKFLAQIARRNGISGFTAEVLPENKGMQAVFNHSEFKVSSHHHGDVCSYALDFE
jgi:GNAT superfamily N-acetyltransferase